MKRKLNEQQGRRIVEKIARGLVDEARDRATATVAPDPITDLFLGIKFRGDDQKHEAIRRTRSYCYQQIGDNWTKQQDARATETAGLRAQISALNEALRTAKRRNAEDVIEAIQSVHRGEILGMAAERRD
jgi:hypothetical protein